MNHFSFLNKNNPYKKECEDIDNKLESESTPQMASFVVMNVGNILENLTKDLIKFEGLNEELEQLIEKNSDARNQWGRLIILTDYLIIPENQATNFHQARKIRNKALHGEIEVTMAHARMMRSYLLKIMKWYDQEYIINPLDMYEYLEEMTDDVDIIDMIKNEITNKTITTTNQIKERIQEELNNYTDELIIESSIEKIIRKEINFGTITNTKTIDERIEEIKYYYLEQHTNDEEIIKILKKEITNKTITTTKQIKEKIKEELNKYIENLNEEEDIERTIKREINFGTITNTKTIDEKIKKIKLHRKPKIQRPPKFNTIQVGVANIINKENNMKYTIQSKDIDKKIDETINKLEKNNHENKLLQEDYNKYEASSFEVKIVIISLNEEQSKITEKEEILFNATKSYNLQHNRKK